ncbi:MAG: virulence factor [Alphaproteobacteria bacterium]|nr:virulence factor [Alphaproteobacteria bacterium]
MANLVVIYWRDIPAQVIVEKGRGRGRESAKVELPKRFIAAIDAAAMKSGAEEADDYLEEWRRSDPIEVADGGMESTAAAKASELEDAYPAERLRALIANGGREG